MPLGYSHATSRATADLLLRVSPGAKGNSTAPRPAPRCPMPHSDKTSAARRMRNGTIKNIETASSQGLPLP